MPSRCPRSWLWAQVPKFQVISFSQYSTVFCPVSSPDMCQAIAPAGVVCRRGHGTVHIWVFFPVLLSQSSSRAPAFPSTPQKCPKKIPFRGPRLGVKTLCFRVLVCSETTTPLNKEAGNYMQRHGLSYPQVEKKQDNLIQWDQTRN